MVSSENFEVLHKILTKIAGDSTTYAVAHVPASDASFDRDDTFGSVSGETEQSFDPEQTTSVNTSRQSHRSSQSKSSDPSFDPERTTSVNTSRPSHLSSKTDVYREQSKGSKNGFDPEAQLPRSQNSPRFSAI
jgi:hypothetical protein